MSNDTTLPVRVTSLDKPWSCQRDNIVSESGTKRGLGAPAPRAQRIFGIHALKTTRKTGNIRVLLKNLAIAKLSDY